VFTHNFVTAQYHYMQLYVSRTGAKNSPQSATGAAG
jgi:hypothetical protein